MRLSILRYWSTERHDGLFSASWAFSGGYSGEHSSFGSDEDGVIFGDGVERGSGVMLNRAASSGEELEPKFQRRGQL